MRDRSEYDDDLPDVNDRRGHERPTTAGMIGFILCLVSLGLLGVVAVLWYALSVENQQQQNHERTRLMVLWFGVLDVGSFCTALTAIIFSCRALTPANPLYRGFGLAGLLLGIGELVVTAIVGVILFCTAMIINLGGG